MATSSRRERVVATRGRAHSIVKNKINGSPALALAHYISGSRVPLCGVTAILHPGPKTRCGKNHDEVSVHDR